MSQHRFKKTNIYLNNAKFVTVVCVFLLHGLLLSALLLYSPQIKPEKLPIMVQIVNIAQKNQNEIKKPEITQQTPTLKPLPKAVTQATTPVKPIQPKVVSSSKNSSNPMAVAKPAEVSNNKTVTSPVEQPANNTPAAPKANSEAKSAEPSPAKEEGKTLGVCFIRLVTPNYSSQLQADGQIGSVTVSAIIAKTGEVKSTNVTAPSEFNELNKLAKNALQKSLFKPALQNGQPIEVSISRTYIFGNGGISQKSGNVKPCS